MAVFVGRRLQAVLARFLAIFLLLALIKPPFAPISIFLSLFWLFFGIIKILFLKFLKSKKLSSFCYEALKKNKYVIN